MSKRTCIGSLVAAMAGCVLFLGASPATAGMGDAVPTFGGTGVVPVAGNGGPFVFERADGRIVVVGMSPDGDAVAVNRFLATGMTDPSFGTGGQRVVDLPGIQETYVYAAALQPDEKLVIGGSHWINFEGAYPYTARLDADGTPDSSFSGGVATLHEATEPVYTSVLVMPSAEVLLAISDWTHDRIDRYSPDGRYLGNLSGAIAPSRLAIQSDGRVIATGYHRDLKQSVVMRIDARGQRDQSFGTDGYATVTAGYDEIVAVEPGGDRILLCGPSGVARLTPDGHSDTAFGADGTGYVTFGAAGVPAFQVCEGLVPLLGGGLAYAAGRYGATGSMGPGAVYVGGLTESGSVDTRFGAGQGFSAIGFGAVYTTTGWGYTSASFVPTRDGNALLTSLGYPVAPEQASVPLLAKIDLGGESLIASMPTPTPNPTPTPTPIQTGTSGGGGGGSLAGLDMALLGLLAAAGMSRRRFRRDAPSTN